MNIDWSKAPEDATHHCSARNTWFKNDEHDMWLIWQSYGRMHEKPLIGWCFCYAPDGDSLSAKEWTGEGLPPVGTVCEFDGFYPDETLPTDPLVGDQVTVIAHFKSGPIELAAFTFHAPPEFEFLQVGQGAHGCFRPIRTPEQAAMEERDQASFELAGILAGHDQHIAVRDIEMAKYLYDIGYRKQVQP